MGIIERENKLFANWLKHWETLVASGEMVRPSCFSFDGLGTRDESHYQNSKDKILFVLKDRNWGFNAGDEISSNGEIEIEQDQKYTFDGWWLTIAQWAAAMQSETESWSDIEKMVRHESNEIYRSMLSTPVIQMKKCPGGGGGNIDSYYAFAKRDKSFVIEQINIYQPRFIVACGNGDILQKVVFDVKENVRTAPNGVKYFFTLKQSGLSRSACVIDFCHPSVRCGNKLTGIVALALRDVIQHVKAKHGNDFI